MHMQTINAGQLEARQVLQGIRCAKGKAAKIIAINGGQELTFRKGNCLIELLIEDKGKYPP